MAAAAQQHRMGLGSQLGPVPLAMRACKLRIPFTGSWKANELVKDGGAGLKQLQGRASSWPGLWFLASASTGQVTVVKGDTVHRRWG